MFYIPIYLILYDIHFYFVQFILLYKDTDTRAKGSEPQHADQPWYFEFLRTTNEDLEEK